MCTRHAMWRAQSPMAAAPVAPVRHQSHLQMGFVNLACTLILGSAALLQQYLFGVAG